MNNNDKTKKRKIRTFRTRREEKWNFKFPKNICTNFNVCKNGWQNWNKLKRYCTVLVWISFILGILWRGTDPFSIILKHLFPANDIDNSFFFLNGQYLGTMQGLKSQMNDHRHKNQFNNVTVRSPSKLSTNISVKRLTSHTESDLSTDRYYLPGKMNKYDFSADFIPQFPRWSQKKNRQLDLCMKLFHRVHITHSRKQTDILHKYFIYMWCVHTLIPNSWLE